MAIPVQTQQIAWLAGLLEGEGCFSLQKGNSINIQLSMTDQDVVNKAGSLVGSSTLEYDVIRHEKRHKRRYRWNLTGNRAAGWMMTLYPFMGHRRKAKIRTLLSAWKSCKPRYEMAICEHLEQPNYGRGLCKTCHARDWAQKHALLRKETRQAAA